MYRYENEEIEFKTDFVTVKKKEIIQTPNIVFCAIFTLSDNDRVKVNT